jgi:hypothetical protein
VSVSLEAEESKSTCVIWRSSSNSKRGADREKDGEIEEKNCLHAVIFL